MKIYKLIIQVTGVAVKRKK